MLMWVGVLLLVNVVMGWDDCYYNILMLWNSDGIVD